MVSQQSTLVIVHELRKISPNQYSKTILANISSVLKITKSKEIIQRQN